MKHHIIYVPGLSDYIAWGQRGITFFWQILGVRVHYFPLRWAEKESFEIKLERVLKKIDELESKGKKVSLVGVSAGGSAAINIFARRKNINKVVIICGKLHRPHHMPKDRYEVNPAFKESMFLVEKSLAKLGPKQRSKILCVNALNDPYVPPKDSSIKGAHTYTVDSKGHKRGIYFTILLRPKMIRSFIASR